MSGATVGGAPVIGVTTYGRNDENHFHLPADYLDAVRRAGGIPLMIPPGERELRQVMSVLDGLMLTGGGDIDPECYRGQRHPMLYNIDHERDATEIALARCAVESQLPMLGICRGLQVLNVALGGTLIEHIPDAYGDGVLHRAPPREPIPHPVIVKPVSRLAEVIGEVKFTSASWHHQAIGQLAARLEVVAHAADGVIEGVELPEHPWLVAVQWHPELTAAYDQLQQRLFEAFVSTAAG